MHPSLSKLSYSHLSSQGHMKWIRNYTVVHMIMNVLSLHSAVYGVNDLSISTMILLFIFADFISLDL